ncbi:MAG: DUF4440 domain-containing protein [Longimicrobiales bacterium]|nr:DUF4440 domain-containing protein [Longimicrobiales bacterium]
MTRVGVVLAMLALGAGGAAAQAESDVASIDGIVAALYGSISGPAGDRDWDRFHSLFLPDAILLNAGPRPDTVAPTPVSPEGYRERTAPFFAENPFYETEIARTTHRYGRVAQLWSTYESRRELEGAPVSRGINSIVLVRDGGRWWVASIVWDFERPDSPIPEAYLPGGG